MNNDKVFVAINPDNDDCFAWCSAHPDYRDDASQAITRWKQQGAEIYWVSRNLARRLLLRQVLIA